MTDVTEAGGAREEKAREPSDREREALAKLSKTVGAVIFESRYGGLDWRISSYHGTRLESVAEVARLSGSVAAGRPIVILAAREGQDFDAFWAEFYDARDGHPWAHRSFWKAGYGTWVPHLPASSKSHPGLLSYYQTEAKRALDIRTPVKPGRYLKKFFADVLSEEEIQELAIEWHTWATPPELHVTQDADEIEEVYVNGPRSCMSYDASDYKGFCHPSRVYAGPDLAVAFIGSSDDAAGRAVVWPEKKVFGRVYGDIHRMKLALETAGFTYNEDALEGARIRRLYDDDLDCHVVPYVDSHAWARDEGDYLVLSSGHRGVYLKQTNGTNEENPGSRATCELCDEGFDEDDVSYVEALEVMCCDSCRSERTFTCEATGHVHDNGEQLEGPNYTTYGPDADTFYCDRTEVHYLQSTHRYARFIRVYESVEMADGETWEASVFAADGFTDAWTGENFPNSECMPLPDGRKVCAESYRLLMEEGEDPEFLTAPPAGRDEHPDQMELALPAAPDEEIPMVLVVGSVWDELDGHSFRLLDRHPRDPVSWGIHLGDRAWREAVGHEANGSAPDGRGWYVSTSRLVPLNDAARALLDAQSASAQLAA